MSGPLCPRHSCKFTVNWAIIERLRLVQGAIKRWTWTIARRPTASGYSKRHRHPVRRVIAMTRPEIKSIMMPGSGTAAIRPCRIPQCDRRIDIEIESKGIVQPVGVHLIETIDTSTIIDKRIGQGDAVLAIRTDEVRTSRIQTRIDSIEAHDRAVDVVLVMAVAAKSVARR